MMIVNVKTKQMYLLINSNLEQVDYSNLFINAHNSIII